MTATLLTGGALAKEIRERTAAAARQLTEAGTQPRLAVVVATEDQGSAWYVGSIARSAAKVGVACDIVDLGATASPAEIEASLRRLSADPTVHGIILQTPLPKGASAAELAEAIDPAKDIDGAGSANLGRLLGSRTAFAPATAEAVLALLDHHGIALRGVNAVVVGRSIVVGKPAAHLLLDRDATVTVCHSRTADLAAHTRQAEVLVVAAGRRGLITPEHVRPGAVVIDVGTNPDDSGAIVGDVDTESIMEVAGAVTPVPGGVGPVTSMLLLAHTVRSAENRPN